MVTTRRQRRLKVARSINDVSDDQLWQILLCLDSPVWLIRAACACKRWRRVIAGADEGRAFLRTTSSLHPPTVVGQYHNYYVVVKVDPNNRFVPSSSPAAAPIDGCHFDVGHLRFKNSSWHVTYCYGGLVLLRRLHRQYPDLVPNLVVYDPLTHNHRKIYSPPPPHRQLDGADIRDAFLLDGDDGNISISNFSVFYCCWKTTGNADPDACVFSTAKGGHWHFVKEDGFTCQSWTVAGHVDRSLYLGMFSGFVAALDNTSFLFSKVALPIRQDMLTNRRLRSTFTVVHGAGISPASPPRTSIVHVRGEELEFFRRINGSGEWMLEHIIHNCSETAATCGLLVSLEKKHMGWTMLGTTMKNGMAWSTMASSSNADSSAMAILSVCRSDDSDNKVCSRWFFTIDVNTKELKVLPQVPYCNKTVSISTYTLPWPQFLRACP